MLTRMIYASEAADALRPALVDDLMAAARRNNRRHDITGLLLFDSQCFLQVLEGSRQSLSDLYARLLQDRRHRHLVLMQVEPIAERMFADWSMGFLAADASNRRLLLRLGGSGRFDPYSLSAAAALTLLGSLAHLAPREPAEPQQA